MKFLCALFAGLALALTASAQTISVTPSQTEISVAPGFNHAPVRLAIAYAGDFTRLKITSDSTWATGVIDATNRVAVISFTSGALINRTYTGTFTVTDGTTSVQAFVRATVAQLNITALLDDPIRSRMYGIQQDGVGTGSLVIIDPLTLEPVNNISVGKHPTDFAISADGSEMLVICTIDKSLTAIDLKTLTVRETIPLASYADWSSTGETSGHIKYGAGNLLYYIDGSWGPVLHVFNRATRTEVQSIFFDGSAYSNAGNATSGFGDFVLSPDKTAAFGWAQYGWSAGLSSSGVSKFTISATGTVKPASTANSSGFPSGIQRDPLNTPALLSADGKILVIKQFGFDASASSLTAATRTFPGPIISMSPGAEVVATSSSLYDFNTGNKLLDLPSSSSVQAVTSDYARLVYFDTTSKTLKSINLFEKVGGTVLRRDSSPANQSIVLPPSALQWAPLAGVDRYRVYLGESLSAVTQAGPSSPELLAAVTTSSVALTTPLVAGKTYYWRVDIVTDAETIPGQLQSFTVSSIASSVSTIDRSTVRGHADYAISVNLTSAVAGKSWSASSSASWVKFGSGSGVTPATLRVSLDASALAAGVATTEIKITTPEGAFTIPVRLQVDPLTLTVIRSDPKSSKLYAVSEVTATSGSSGTGTSGVVTTGAYLLEIDSATQAITRVVAVGRSVTDIAIHAGDNRIYVTNWATGSLLALNRDTLALERTYGFNAFQGIGYGDGDVYRIAAGGPGRLLVEEMDQWIDISLFDTTNGTTLGKAFVREGGGQYLPGERYYFHGENNSSGAELRKFDTLADKLTEVAHNRGNLSSYYGSRTVVVSEDGNRVFWSGVMYSAADLTELWASNDIIYAVSKDGRYAFAESKIYDTVSKKMIFGMPAATRVIGFNTQTSKLVIQQDQRIAFFSLDTGSVLATPVLAVDTRTSNTVKLTWVEDALQNGFTLQMRVAGAANWSDISAVIASTATSYTVTGLKEETSYEFRIKADGPNSSSAWSTPVTGTTLIAPPSIPSFGNAVAASPTSVTLTWTVSGTYDSVTIERILSNGTATQWTTVTTVASPGVTYTDTGLTTSTTYVYRLKATRQGSDSSYSSQRSVTLQPPVAPAITRQPVGQTVLAGTAVTFTATVTGNPLPTFQWYRDGVAVPGATASTLTITPSTLDAGVYKMVATNSVGSVTSNDFTLTVTPSTSRMINFSVLANAGSGAPLTVGFTLSGGAKNVLVRGLGPTLGAVGVSGVMTDPQMTLYRHTGSGTVALLSNNDWSSSTNKSSLLSATSRLTGLPFVSDPSRDAALLALLNIDGGYSAEISSADRSSGAVLVEVYDADSGTPSRLANISALSPVSPGVSLTAGFVISGTTRKTVLIRAAGPALRKVGVTDAHADPQLTLFRQATTPIPIATSNDWGTATNKAEILTVSSAITGLALDEGSKDSAIVVTLDPGAYTAQATSANGGSGLVLIEVYDVP